MDMMKLVSQIGNEFGSKVPEQVDRSVFIALSHDVELHLETSAQPGELYAYIYLFPLGPVSAATIQQKLAQLTLQGYLERAVRIVPSHERNMFVILERFSVDDLNHDDFIEELHGLVKIVRFLRDQWQNWCSECVNRVLPQPNGKVQASRIATITQMDLQQ